MNKIIIIGLGPGNIGSLTLDAVEKISNGNRIYLRTEKHPTIKYFEEKNIEYKSYDYLYKEKDSLKEVYESITKDLLKNANKYGIINYCVPGNPILGEKTVSMLMDLKKNGEIDIEIISAMSFIEAIITALGEDTISGLKILDGIDFKDHNLDINSNNIITHVYSQELASEVKLKLSEVYEDDYEVHIIKAAGVEKEEKIVKVPIYNIDRLDWIDHLTSIYIPKVVKINKKCYDMNNLIDIMETLRSEDGCKWDIKQTHESLREYLIEEAYEVVDAINKEDIDGVCEELGDVLLQVVFHSQIAKEEGYFNIWDVISNICYKLIYRHPHVFGNQEARNDKEAIDNWNEMKDKEKSITSYTQRLENVTKTLPSLLKSYKIQDKASDVGFDWDNVEDAFKKVEEEMLEVKETLEGDDKVRQEEEIGDLLFAIVNVCRYTGVNPETALNKTINKFIKRFSYIENEGKKQKKDLKDMTLEEMDKLWEKSKTHK